MAAIPNASRLTLRVLAGLLCFCCAGPGQINLTLQQAASRRPPDLAPYYAGQTATVHGRVSSRALRIMTEYAHIGIEQNGDGLILEDGGARLDALQPGDEVEATGTVSARGGMPVLAVSSVRVRSHGAPPAPAPVRLEDLLGFRYLGRLVVTEGRVVEKGENTAGTFLLIGSEETFYKLFLPETPGKPDLRLTGFAIGDTVRATGVASQYCPSAPFNRWFQLNVANPTDVVWTGHPLVVPRALWFGFAMAALVFGLVWWTRERRLRAQREVLRRSYELGEEILGAASAQDILAKTTTVLPKVMGITRVVLYVYNPGAQTLEEVAQRVDDATVSIPLASPRGGIQTGAAACFQNRTVLSVPDSSRSPFPGPDEPAPPMPVSVLFVPMFAQGEAVGVLELDHDRQARGFNSHELALAQHLGNQIGVTLRLLDQRLVREQLFRTEKVAAVGRMISGVVNELQTPLSSLCNLVQVAMAEQDLERLPDISKEARKAAEIVSRLVSFASSESVEARPVDVNRLLRNLAEFREREWKARGIRVRVAIPEGPLLVLGSQGQLEQVLLDLIVHAEQTLAEAAEKHITLRSTRLARRVLVEIGYSGPRGVDPFDAWNQGSATLGLGVCRSIIAGHGGELHAISTADAGPRFEVELPWAGRETAPAPTAEGLAQASSRSLTALVIEPDDAVERQILAILTRRGHRVVPVKSSDTGLDLVQRMRFDIVFCSVRAPGLNWVELSERLQTRVGGFMLLSDGYDRELSEDFEGEGRWVVSKPLDEVYVDSILRRIEGRMASGMAAG
jgi:C4-dicarboxylate-specific signal transduction histidine kinase